MLYPKLNRCFLAALAATGLAAACTAPVPGYHEDAGDTDASTTSPDASTGDDGGDSLEAPRALSPANGFATGSIHAPATLTAHPLKPRFIWTAVASAGSYQLQVTSECTVDNFRDCAFASPAVDENVTETTHRLASALAVSTTAPVGRRYFWRVRACADGIGCSAWTEVRYLDVGRQRQDVDGDGYADLAIGAQGENNLAGRAYIFDGATPPATLNGIESMDFFGSVAFVGDVNADGFAEILVGAPGEEGFGIAHLYFGAANGIEASAEVSLASGDPEANGAFGTSVAGAGDVNGDGYADVVIGARDENEGQGAAYIFFGGSDDLDNLADVTLTAPGSLLFGFAVAGGGDFNADGYADVIVGTYRIDVSGKGYLFHGGSNVDGTADAVLASPNPEAQGGFGSAVAGAGDINGDGFGDVIVGAYGENANAGRTYVYRGSASGIATSPAATIDGSPDHGLGSAVAGAGDINGDGYDDVIIGATGASNSAGLVKVFRGADGGLAINGATLNSGASTQEGRFGQAAAGAGDVNGDGYADIVVGAPFENNAVNRSGNAYIFDGDADGVVLSPSARLESPNTEGAGEFGGSVS